LKRQSKHLWGVNTDDIVAIAFCHPIAGTNAGNIPETYVVNTSMQMMGLTARFTTQIGIVIIRFAHGMDFRMVAVLEPLYSVHY
jgi:hypothetical protein